MHTGLSPARRWAALGALVLPVLLISMDATILSFALPTLSADLAPSSTQLLWIVDIYSFVVAGLLVVMGNLGDRIGRRRILLIGSAAFAAASALAAFAPDPPTLLAARALLGAAGATLMPSTLSLLRNIFLDDHERRFAISLWVVMFSVGGVLGPLVGGWMLEHFWWGSVFLVGVPTSLAVLVLVPLLVPESRDPAPGRWDPRSAALALGATLPVVWAIKEAATHGVSVVAALVALAGVAAGAAFARRQRALADPMLDLGLFRDPRFRAAAIGNAALMFTFAGTLFLLTQYLQVVGELSPLRAGVVLVPGLGLAVVCTLGATRLARRVGTAAVVVAGMAMVGVGLVVLAGVSGHGDTTQVAVAFALLGAGTNLASSLLVSAVLDALPPAKAGAGAAVSETGVELGIALGTALLGTLALALYRNGLADAALPVDDSTLASARESLGGALHAAEGLDAATATRLLDATHDSFATGVRAASVAAAVVVVLTAIVTGRSLGDRRPAGRDADGAAEAEATPTRGADVPS